MFLGREGGLQCKDKPYSSGKHFVRESITSNSNGGGYSGYVCTLEVEEMTGGDCGEREDDSCDETISSGDENIVLLLKCNPASDSGMAMSGDGVEEKHNGASGEVKEKSQKAKKIQFAKE
ncbi:hypothetical protein DY000_02001208 [Brassica cretica]|uniref:MATH domain-containing protein n=1 Tax=Brassica cretica TaxID=69181 RepID=A0ABQ7CI10_BRACR|nr:hypothetical protein DY000_02001208 [Brassica cretica]